MRILRLESENIKRLSAVEIKPDGALVQITGRNAQGKSSVLDSIVYALAGERAIEWEPVRHGAEQAHVTLDLGDDEGGLRLRVTRRFRAKEGRSGTKPYTTSLAVEDASGMRPMAPQELLNTIVGAIAFNPLEFAEGAPKEQVALLRQLVPGVDFDAIERRRKELTEERTALNRRAREERARATGVTVPPGAPTAPVDVSAIQDRLASLGAAAADRAREEGRQERVRRQLQDARADLVEIAEKIARLKAESDRVAGTIATIEATESSLPPLPEMPDPAAIRAELAAAQAANAAYAKAQQRAELEQAVANAEAQAAARTEAIEALDHQVKVAIETADLPVRGLSFDAEGVFLNGVPFAQASAAEKLRASMALAMAMNPRLRVIRIEKGGNDLDADAMAVLAAVAEADGWQVWIERVVQAGPAAIEIEDGRVKQ